MTIQVKKYFVKFILSYSVSLQLSTSTFGNTVGNTLFRPQRQKDKQLVFASPSERGTARPRNQIHTDRKNLYIQKIISRVSESGIEKKFSVMFFRRNFFFSKKIQFSQFFSQIKLKKNNFWYFQTFSNIFCLISLTKSFL